MSFMSYNNNRGYLYDGRNRLNHQFYYPPNVEYDFQSMRRPRPAQTTVLNRKFKKTTIQLDEQRVLVIHVQANKSKRHHLVFAECEGSFENKIQDVSIPESLVVPWIQQFHKFSKWRPGTTASIPSSQGLINDTRVYKIDIISLTRPELQLENPEYAVKLFIESRSKDPANRQVLSSVLIPLRSNYLVKIKEALDDVLVTQSPLYHTETLMTRDGNKIYMDMIREAMGKHPNSHYLKLSHVTRDFRSIIHISADELEAVRTMLDACIKAKKSQDEEPTKKPKKKSSKNRNRRVRKKSGENKENQTSSDSGEEKEEEVEEKIQKIPEVRSDGDSAGKNEVNQPLVSLPQEQ